LFKLKTAYKKQRKQQQLNCYQEKKNYIVKYHKCIDIMVQSISYKKIHTLTTKATATDTTPLSQQQFTPSVSTTKAVTPTITTRSSTIRPLPPTTASKTTNTTTNNDNVRALVKFSVTWGKALTFWQYSAVF